MKSIIDTAKSISGFSKFVEAINTAGLIDVIERDGPLTIFAPTNDAFENSPTFENLQNVLTHHIIRGEVLAKDIKDGCLKSMNGTDLCFDGLKVENANITGTDIYCKNGIIHIIDGVMIPN